MAASSMSLDLKVRNVRDVDRGLRAFSKRFGVDVNFVCADQLRLWVKDLIGPKVTMPAKSVKGKAQIADDLENVLAPVPPGAKVIRLADKTLIKAVSGAVWATEAGGHTDSESQLESVHQERKLPIRTSRGRVRFGRPEYRSNGLKIVPKLHAQQALYRRYRRKVQSRVGTLKNGWADALRELGRYVRASTKIPAWVRKAPRVSGTASTGMGEKGGQVSATNNVQNADVMYRSWLPTTRLKRYKDIRGAMWKRANRLIAQFNAGGV